MEITRRQYRLGDETWDEVQFINSHAVFMAYLSMGVKGLGFLVLTWTTVVLLGGFVSVLQQKDFWCLTFITLVQTAGIFDVYMNEKLGYVKNAIFGLKAGVFFTVAGDMRSLLEGSSASLWPLVVFVTQLLLAYVLVFVQGMVLAAVLCPLVIVYMLGILMSGGISLWRLLEHDYRGNSNSDSGETSNLAPAMDTLYYLALLQAVLFCYRFILRCAGKKLIKRTMGKNYHDTVLHVLYNYLRETKIGCEKDPSFAKGRNLITHAIDKICSNSPLDCISGVKILYTAIGFVESELPQLYSKKESDDYPSHVLYLIGQRTLMKHMVVFNASSSKHILQKLLEMLDARGLHNTETRNQARKIVDHLAFYINLEDFPRGIQQIASLVGTFEEYSIAEPYQRDLLLDVYEQHWHLHACCLPPSPAHRDELRLAYKESLLQGLSILRKLAANENNCRVMSNTGGLLCKIMAPITSDLLHHTTDDHGAWSNVVERSMEVMSQLISASGETGAKLRREISSFKKAVNTLRRILSCKKCKELQLIAMHILTRLYMDSESSRSTDDFTIHQKESYNREDFVRMLVDIFMSDNTYSSSVRGYAGGALSKICFHEESSDATIVIKTSGDLHNLIEVLLHDKNEICRQAAAELLEHLCTHNTMDEQYIGKLKKAIVEVIGEIIRCGDETHAGKEADKGGFAKPKTDIESQCYNGRGKGISFSSSSHPEKNEEDDEFQVVVQPVISMKLLSSLLSLCGTFCDTFIMELGSPYLAPHQLDASTFLNKLKEVVVKRSDNPSVENLTLYKTIGKMVISMKKHNNNEFVKQDLESLLEALSTASKNMLDLDHSMVFRSDNSSESSKDEYTLASLVKQAQELRVVVSYG